MKLTYIFVVTGRKNDGSGRPNINGSGSGRLKINGSDRIRILIPGQNNKKFLNKTDNRVYGPSLHIQAFTV